MQSNRKRIRKVFAPLTTATSIRCATPASPTTQVYNGSLVEYEPDRELTPTIILPEVVAHATDGSWPNPYSNSLLADMHWFVNGQDITSLADWNGKYEIDQVGDTRGAITVKKNISPGETVELHFEAKLADTRLGINIPIVTDKITLSTTEKSSDGYSISVKDGGIVQYDPIKDKLHLYEYKVAHGLITASAAEQAAATDNCAYLHKIPFHIFNGKKLKTSGYTIRVYRVDSPTTLTLLTASAHNELVSQTLNEIVLDLRLIEKASYAIKAYVKNVEVASFEIGVNRIYQKYHITPTNGTAIHPDDTERYDKVMADCDGNIIECPGSVFQITWYTDTEALKGVKHNEGDETVYQLVKTGIGNTASDDWLETYVDCKYKEQHKIAVSGSTTWTDNNGNPYIFN